ncbi:MAG: hypothetical protein A2136_09405 [Chloroflexi bacterium RBG_16_54_11]|nr:MAG: hypothetical protein A2136_09405 [Chloroflexi bacterium RBG_16_54_11]
MNMQLEGPQPVYTVRPITPETEGAAATAMWLEIIFGIFSLLGVGHVYSGRTLLGIALMVGWWLYIIVATVLSTVTLGIGACLFLPIYIAVPIISGIQARTYMQKENGKGHWGTVALVGGGGCLLIIIVVGSLAALGILTAVVSQYNTR